jgi:CO/xanthine dehydrogenase FAD-binding subunit
VAASLTLAGGAISDARLAFAGMSDVPVRAAEAEDFLVGEIPSQNLFEEAARLATAEITPPADLHGSSEYRKRVAATLVRRGLQAAADGAASDGAASDGAASDGAASDGAASNRPDERQ